MKKINGGKGACLKSIEVQGLGGIVRSTTMLIATRERKFW